MPKIIPALTAVAVLLVVAGFELPPAPGTDTTGQEQNAQVPKTRGIVLQDGTPETSQKSDNLGTYLARNKRKADIAFKEFVLSNAGKVISYTDQFKRVISYKDTRFNGSHYEILVHYVYCNPDVVCRERSVQDQFAAQFENGELIFLRKL